MHEVWRLRRELFLWHGIAYLFLVNKCRWLVLLQCLALCVCMLLNVCIFIKALQFCDLYRKKCGTYSCCVVGLLSRRVQHLLLCYVKQQKLVAENMFELVVLSGSLSSFVVSFWGLASQGTQSDLASRKQSSKVQFRAYNFCLANFAGSEKATRFIVFFCLLG